MVNWPQGCIITNTFPKIPLENLGILQPWLVPKRKVGSSAGTLALNCIPEYKIHIKSIPFFALACFPAGRFSPIVCRFLMKTASWPSKSPKFSRCADFTKGATHPPLRGFPTHLRTHLPVGVRAPFRPRDQNSYPTEARIQTGRSGPRKTG